MEEALQKPTNQTKNLGYKSLFWELPLREIFPLGAVSPPSQPKSHVRFFVINHTVLWVLFIKPDYLGSRDQLCIS
jgi:hypothetical protein